MKKYSFKHSDKKTKCQNEWCHSDSLSVPIHIKGLLKLSLPTNSNATANDLILKADQCTCNVPIHKCPFSWLPLPP